MSYVSHYEGPRPQTWRTPRALFDPLQDEFHFTLDGAAMANDALLPRYGYDFITWQGYRVFCNPPWNAIRQFVELAVTADLAVLLVPARVNTKWFHRALELGATVRFFVGRPSFEMIERSGNGHNSPVDCLYLIFRKD